MAIYQLTFWNSCMKGNCLRRRSALSKIATRSIDMRICKTVFIGIFILVFSTPLLAADVIKLGYFNLQTIIDRSEMGKEGLGKFQGEMKSVREKLEAQRQEVKVLQDEFKTKEQVWSNDVKKAKLQEIMAREGKLKRAFEQANRELAKREQAILEPLKDRMLEVISRIGKEEGYTMILDTVESGIAYAPASLDLTDRIIRELNEISAKGAGKP